MESAKPMRPKPAALFSESGRRASGIGSSLMSTRLSNWRVARRTDSSRQCQSIWPLLMCLARLMDTRLQTATFSLSVGRVTSVQRLEQWMVPVLLLRARMLMESFQVSQGWEVVSNDIRIFLYCWLAGREDHIFILPFFASSTYSLYLLENASP